MLTETQRAFVTQFLHCGFRAKKKNAKILSAFESYADAENRFKALAAEVPRDHPGMPQVISGLTPVLAEKKAGRFAEATVLMEALILEAQKVKQSVIDRRLVQRNRLLRLVDPPGSVDPELTAMGQLRIKVTGLISAPLPLPTNAALLEATAALDELQVLVDKVLELKAWKEEGVDAVSKIAAPTTGSEADKETLRLLRKELGRLHALPSPSGEDRAAAATALARLKRLTADIGKGIAVRDSDSVASLKDSGRDKAAAKAYELLETLGGALGDLEVTPQVLADADQEIVDAETRRVQAYQDWSEANSRAVTTEDERNQRALDLQAHADAYDQAESDKAAARTYRQQLAARQLLPDALATGPVSAHDRGPLDDEDLEKLVSAYGKDARLADEVVRDMAGATHPKAVAGHLEELCDLSATGFASGDGTSFNEAYSREYAAKILKMGGTLGEEAFTGLADYIDSGEHFKPNPLDIPLPGTFTELGQVRTRAVAQSLVGDDGTLDPGAADLTLQHLRFHPKVLENPTPELARHAQETLKLFTDPSTSGDVEFVLDGANADADDPSANELVRSTLGMGGTELVEDQHVKRAIVSAMFTPLTQGPVGSCFSTGPCRRQRQIDPLATMRSYAQLASQGTITPANGGSDVPAVTRLPEHENPLMRSLEYTLATIAAQAPGSDRSTTLSNALERGADALRPDGKAGGISWNARRASLVQSVTDSLTWIYDPLIKTEVSNDGSSSQGRYLVRRVSDGKDITTRAEFIEVITDIVLAELQQDDPALERSAIESKVSAPAFIDAVCQGGYKPWEQSSGGYDKEVTEALLGGTVAVKPMLPAGTGTDSEGTRTTQVLESLLGSFQGSTDEMAIIKTMGQHTFNALPNHPSLTALKGSDPTETSQKVRENLLEPGELIRDTALTTERAVALFEQEVRRVLKGEEVGELIVLLNTALTLKPSRAMTPAELDQLLATALEPYHTRKSVLDTDKWVSAQIMGGKRADPTAKGKYRTDRLANLKKWQTQANQDLLLKATGAPEFVIADTNWGDERSIQQFVIAPDPRTGEPLLWKKIVPPGQMIPMDREWVDKGWSMVE